MSKKTAVIDGANIAYIEKSQKGEPKVSSILAVRSELEENGYESLVIVDASLAYEIDDRSQLEEHPWLNKRRVPAMIVRGHVEPYEPRLE